MHRVLFSALTYILWAMTLSSKREDVYRVVKAFATRGEWVNAEAKHYTQALVRSKTFFVFLVCNKENAGC